MAKTQAIRQRIKSVKNIHQITKTMEMVSASKLHKAQEAALQSRMYSFSAREALTRLKKIAPNYIHPLFAQRDIKTQLVLFLQVIVVWQELITEISSRNLLDS